MSFCIEHILGTSCLHECLHLGYFVCYAHEMYKQCFCSCRNGKNFKSMSDMRSAGDQLLKEKGGLSLSVVKSLVRRDKEERLSSEFFGDEETQSLMYSLFKYGMLSLDVLRMFVCTVILNYDA